MISRIWTKRYWLIAGLFLLGATAAHADLLRVKECTSSCKNLNCGDSGTQACISACEFGMPPSCPDCHARCTAFGCQGQDLTLCENECHQGILHFTCGSGHYCDEACSELSCDPLQYEQCKSLCSAGAAPACPPKRSCEDQCDVFKGTFGCETEEALQACVSGCKATGKTICGVSDCPEKCWSSGCHDREDYMACRGACEATGVPSCGKGNDCVTRCTRTEKCWFPEETQSCIKRCEKSGEAICGGFTCESACAQQNCATQEQTNDCVSYCREHNERIFCGGRKNCTRACESECRGENEYACEHGCEATGLILCGGEKSCQAWCTALPDCPLDHAAACIGKCQEDKVVECPDTSGNKDCSDPDKCPAPKPTTCDSACQSNGCASPTECSNCAKGCQDQINNPGKNPAPSGNASGGGSSNNEATSNPTIDDLYNSAHRTDLTMKEFFDNALEMTSGQTMVYGANMGLKLPDGDLDTEITYTDGRKVVHPFDRGLLSGAPPGAQVLVCCPWPCSMAQQNCYNQLTSYGSGSTIAAIKSIRVVPHPGAVSSIINQAKGKWVAAVKKAVDGRIALEQAKRARIKVRTDEVLRRLAAFADKVWNLRKDLVFDPDFKELFGTVPLSEVTIEKWGKVEVNGKTVREYAPLKSKITLGEGIPHHPRWPCRTQVESGTYGAVEGLGVFDDESPTKIATRFVEKMGLDAQGLSLCVQEARSLSERAQRLKPKVAALAAATHEFESLRQQALAAFPFEERRHPWEGSSSVSISIPEPPKLPPSPKNATDVVLGQDYEQYAQVSQAMADWSTLVKPALQQERVQELIRQEEEQTFAIEKSYAEYAIDAANGFSVKGAQDMEKTSRRYDEFAETLAGIAQKRASFDPAAAARTTLLKLAEAYNLKQRTAFMNLVSDDYLGDTMALEDALLRDFRNYGPVNLDIIVDNTQVSKKPQLTATVAFHYFLTVANNNQAGTSQKFVGGTIYTFRFDEKKGEARLFEMQAPIIFGNSLPLSQNPVATIQGTSSNNSGTAPGSANSSTSSSSSTVVRGNSEQLSSNYNGSAGAGFKFSTQQITTSSLGADIFLGQTGMNCSTLPCLYSSNTQGIQSIGTCSLSNVRSVPTSGYGPAVTPTNQTCYAIKTFDNNHYAAIQVTSIQSSVSLNYWIVTFNYLYQTNGSNTFQ